MDGGTNPAAVHGWICGLLRGGPGGRRPAQQVELGEVSIDSRVSLITTEQRGFNVAIELNVTLPGIDNRARAAEIVATAHQVCPYSNATARQRGGQPHSKRRTRQLTPVNQPRRSPIRRRGRGTPGRSGSGPGPT